MGIQTKQYVKQIVTNNAVVSASQITATIVASFNVEGMFDFTVTVHCSETACTYPYVIQTAPILTPTSYFSALTATSVAASTAGGVTKNTFEENNQAWLRVILTSASEAIALGAMSIILSGNQR